MYSNGGIYIPDRKPPMGAVRNPYLKINRGLVLDTMMWEGAGPTAEDLSGNGWIGTLVSDAEWVAGKYGASIKLSTGGDKIAFPTNVYDMGIRRHATFIIYFRLHNTGVVRSLMSDWNDSLGFNLYIVSGGGSALCYVYPNNHRVDLTYAFAVETDYMIAVVLDGANLYLSVNAGTPASVLLGEDIGDSATTLNFGLRGDGTGAPNQTVHLASIYNRALPAGEIAELSSEPFCGFRWASIIELASYVAAAPSGIPILRRRRAG